MKIKILFAVFVAALAALPGLARAQSEPWPSVDSVELLNHRLPAKEAFIWYLGQDSFAVRTRNHLLIFDPLNPGMENSYVLPESADSLSEGVVNPETIKDLSVIVFSTDMDNTHYGTGIWAWARYISTISYVFGWNPIINQDAHDYVYLRPQETTIIGGVEITTTQASTHGSGFLVKVDGLTLFHGGSHIMLNDSMRRRFMDGIDYIAAQVPQVDIAFLEFQTGAGNRPPSIAEGIWYAEEKLSPRAIFPMGATNGDIPWRIRRAPEGLAMAATTYEHLIRDMIDEAPSDAVRAKIVETGSRGNMFIYRNGRIQ